MPYVPQGVALAKPNYSFEKRKKELEKKKKKEEKLLRKASKRAQAAEEPSADSVPAASTESAAPESDPS